MSPEHYGQLVAFLLLLSFQQCAETLFFRLFSQHPHSEIQPSVTPLLHLALGNNGNRKSHSVASGLKSKNSSGFITFSFWLLFLVTD